MKKFILNNVAISFAGLSLVGCFASKEVAMVQGGTLQMCPNKTVKQMVDGFMGSPAWKSGTSDGGQSFVNIDGDITYNDKPVRATVQFFIKGDQFSFNALELNGVPSPNIIAIGLMQKMCASAK